MNFQLPRAILVDARNIDQLWPTLLEMVTTKGIIGLDCETEDSGRHQGLNDYCGYNAEGKKAKTKPLVFDIRRTVMTGFSLYADGDDVAYYFNLHHADAENRINFNRVRELFTSRPKGCLWIAHNATFEVVMFMMCHGIRLTDIVCTLQMAVSAYGPDDYEPALLRGLGNPFWKLIPSIIRESATYASGQAMSEDLADLFFKIVGKQSTSSFSYNGIIETITPGYGLKKCVRSWFGYEMTTFEEVLGVHAHTGQLTGEEIVSYGADDAFWTVKLFHHFLAKMIADTGDDKLVKTFFDQENPMIQVYADIWMDGLVINSDAVYGKRTDERKHYAKVLRKMRETVKQLLPFPDQPNERLMEVESWYAKGFKKYRDNITAWANLPFEEDDYKEAFRAAGPVSNAWALEGGTKKSNGPNFSHYMPVRTLIYDLTRERPIMSEGKVQSDGDGRGRLKMRFEKRIRNAEEGVDLGREKLAIELLDCLQEISSIEQIMKLYLTPYSKLMDPETGKIYPVVSSMLSTRRMAARYPNPMQLGKRGEATYVRGFYRADDDDHLIVSIDWSGIELVEIGEFSADPEFIKAFGQLPHEDLHSGAAADILSVDVIGMNEKIFKDIKNYEDAEAFLKHYDFLENGKRLFTNLKGEPLSPAGAVKYWRTEIGKGANFNYWYSGFLGTVGERMGWSVETTGRATERYRERFHVAETWRLDLIEELKDNGYITLPDGHRRVRFEATQNWREMFMDMWNLPGQDRLTLGGYYAFANAVASKIQKRSFNQGVNAYIQGSCATIAKRSILRIRKACLDRGWDHRMVRFMMPIHDELVFSVHRTIAAEFITMAREIMITHPDIFQHCKLDASPSIGRTFAPYSPEKNPFGQIELFEAPKLSCVPENKINKRLSQDEVEGVVDYLWKAAA